MRPRGDDRFDLLREVFADAFKRRQIMPRRRNDISDRLRQRLQRPRGITVRAHPKRIRSLQLQQVAQFLKQRRNRRVLHAELIPGGFPQKSQRTQKGQREKREEPRNTRMTRKKAGYGFIIVPTRSVGTSADRAIRPSDHLYPVFLLPSVSSVYSVVPSPLLFCVLLCSLWTIPLLVTSQRSRCCGSGLGCRDLAGRADRAAGLRRPGRRWSFSATPRPCESPRRCVSP